MTSTKKELDLFIQSLIQACPVKWCRPSKKNKSQQEAPLEEDEGLDEAESHTAVKQCASSFKFFVWIREKKMQVCRAAFTSLLVMTEKQVRRLKGLLMVDCSLKDLRGKKQNCTMIPQDVVQQVKEHIRSFPLKISNYSVMNQEVQYLDKKLHIKKNAQPLFRDISRHTCEVQFLLQNIQEFQLQIW